MGLSAASAQRNQARDQMNPEGQPRSFKAGLTHRYFVWHDQTGWHVRTTTAKEKHRFHGEVVAIDGIIGQLSPLPGERFDRAKLSPNKDRIIFDLITVKDLDGFDFKSEAKELRFKLFMDDKERPELVFVGLTAANPSLVPFVMVNPDAKIVVGGSKFITGIGRPKGMGPGSPQRYMLWKDPSDGSWHLRTTTGRNEHTFVGEIVAEGGRIFDLKNEESEKKDFVKLENADRIVFKLVTSGAIDGFGFKTDALSLKFRLTIDGEARKDQVFIGEGAVNPDSIPFTIPVKFRR